MLSIESHLRAQLLWRLYPCPPGIELDQVSRPGSVPVDTRDNLYQSLPPRIKGALRHRIPHFEMRHEVSLAHVKEELERELSWLVPIATYTTKAHHGFGWVGEWANTGSSLDVSLSAQTQFSLIQTLHHADRATTEDCILDLLVLLHYLVCLARDNVSEFRSSLHPSSSQGVQKTMQRDMLHVPISCEGENLEHQCLDDGEPTMSALQTNLELKRLPSSEGSHILTKSDSRSSNRSLEDDISPSVANHVPVDLKLDRVKSLDIMDRVDDI
ncbi:hypothetical protein L7F22_011372 [Adiantum nelumboides]|nr:hypothetical protein [Adiantum nelumboides]